MKEYRISFWDTLYKSILPEKLPRDLQKVVDELKKEESREECLKKAYAIMTSR